MFARYQDFARAVRRTVREVAGGAAFRDHFVAVDVKCRNHDQQQSVARHLRSTRMFRVSVHADHIVSVSDRY